MKVRHFKLTVAYEGTAYGGWQLQPNGVTVQELLEKALAKLAGKRVVVHGSGRTDAGVHARAQVANCTFATRLAPAVLVLALNANLPADVRVLRVQEVTGKPSQRDAEGRGRQFHARFSAKGKEYRYQIDAGQVADPFLRAYAWHHPRPLDVPAMRRAALLLKGRHDFSALCASRVRRDAAVVCGKSDGSSVRTVSRLTITRQGNVLTIAVRANGFLYKMVRSIVGALVKVGEGRLTVEQLRAVVASKKRTALIETAPAKGLFLWEVFY